jgi:nucleotide-binding universal stress UspA family protein
VAAARATVSSCSSPRITKESDDGQYHRADEREGDAARTDPHLLLRLPRRRAGDRADAALLGPRGAVADDVLPWMTPAESMAATSSLVPGNPFKELNSAEARRIAGRDAEIARSAGFEAEPRGELASATWEGIVGLADELDAAVIVIGSRGLTGMKKIFDASVSRQVAEHAGRPVLIVSPPR